MSSAARRIAFDLREELIRGVIGSGEHESRRNHWSYGVMSSLVSDAPEIAFPILLEIIERAPDEALGYVAAGPLEDLIHEHGFQVIDAVEAEAKRSPRFRLALGGVWQGLLVEPIWKRIEALIEGEGRVEFDDELPPLRERHLEWRVTGLPPSISCTAEPEQDARRNLLLAGLREAVLDGFQPWATPVYVKVRVESGPNGDRSASAGDMVAAIVETLSADRTAGLADRAYDGFGAFSSRYLVREVDLFDVFSREPSYVLEVSRMSDEQVESISDPTSFDELMRPKSRQEVRDEIAASYLESEIEITGEMRERLRNQGIELPEPDDNS